MSPMPRCRAQSAAGRPVLRLRAGTATARRGRPPTPGVRTPSPAPSRRIGARGQEHLYDLRGLRLVVGQPPERRDPVIAHLSGQCGVLRENLPYAIDVAPETKCPDVAAVAAQQIDHLLL